jgi:hypothetical protein
MRKPLTLLVGAGILRHCILQVVAICGLYVTAVAKNPARESASNEIHQKAKILKEVTLTGKVLTGETGTGLPGVTVVITEAGGGNKQGTTTNEEGTFTFANLTSGVKYNLEFSYIGFEKQSVNDFLLTETNNNSIEVKMTESASNLGEVVVVGYGSTVKKDITGSVKSLKSTEFNAGIINSPEQLLQGKVSGVSDWRTRC